VFWVELRVWGWGAGLKLEGSGVFGFGGFWMLFAWACCIMKLFVRGTLVLFSKLALFEFALPIPRNFLGASEPILIEFCRAFSKFDGPTLSSNIALTQDIDTFGCCFILKLSDALFIVKNKNQLPTSFGLRSLVNI
jgi:hypothetical protein